MDQLSIDFGCDLIAILDGDNDGISPGSNAAACDNRDLPLVGSHHTATRFSRSFPTTAAIGRPKDADIGVRSIAGIQP
jgi:hypothetical protein